MNRFPGTRTLCGVALAWAALLLGGCGGGGDDAPGPSTETLAAAAAEAQTVRSDLAQPQGEPAAAVASGRMRALAAAGGAREGDPAAVEVGNELFHDPRLSASGRMSCGTCHVQGFGHADAPGTGLPLGGANLDLSGMRSSQTARYLNLAPPFRLAADGTPSGGFLWDGRADNRFEQVFHGGPFFNPVEMALPGSAAQPQALTDRVRSAAYWPALQALYVQAPDLISTAQKLFEQVAVLLEIYQRDDGDYNLFDSRFDAVRARAARFTLSELRGWAIFSDPARGNCTHCHAARLDEASPLFTNFGYAALGVPRNHAGPRNLDPAYFDLGLCARAQGGAAASEVKLIRRSRYCGLFKTPTLRNITRTAPYFHNGAIATLEDAVLFHFQRDSHPAKWYRKADGSADQPYNDLPRHFWGNLAAGKPFDGSWQPGARDLADLIAFLKTLDDSDQSLPLPTRR